MATTTETLRIVNEVVYRGKTQARQLKTDLKDADTEVKKLNVDFDELASGMAIVAGGAAALGAAYVKLYQVMGEGAQVQAAALTFDNLAMSIGSTSDVMLGDLRAATNGMISDMELMQAANQFTAMGLANTSTEAATLAQIGSTLGAAFRGDASAGMEEFALLLANQSIPRLDSFGISAGAVRTRIAELQTEFPNMTREAAFMEAVMEEAQITMGKLGDNTESAAAQMAIAEAMFKNLKDEGAQAVAIGLNPTVQAFNDLATAITGVNQVFTFEGFAEGIGGALSGQVRTLETMTLLAESFGNLNFDDGIGAFFESYYNVIPRTRELNETMEAFAALDGAMGNTYGTGGLVVQARDRLAELDANVVLHIRSMNDLADAHDQTEGAVRSTVSAFEDYNGFTASTFIDTLNAAEVEALDVEQALLQQAAAAGADQTALVMLAAATGDYTEQQIGAALEMAALNAFIESQAAALAAGNITWQEALSSIRAFRDELAALPDSKSVTINVNTVGEVPNLPGEGPGISEYATGTSYHPGGRAIVGEYGPEMIDLPRGASVVSTNRTLNQSTTNNFNAPSRRSEQLIYQSIRRSSRPATITG